MADTGAAGEAVYHLATPDEWAAAEASGRVTPASLATEGFVHCSTAAQVTGTIERHFAGVDELRLLRVDVAAVSADLRWEESRPGEVYPHLYRPLARREVTQVITWRRDADGAVSAPAELG
jgi:uncharacterized protein (DUF952 family)